MEYDLPVAQMARGDDIEGFYVLKSAFSKVANNGKPFLNLTLSDRTGAVDAKVWDYPGPIGAAVRPVCAESELLSYIDMIDSRMEIYREVLGATPLGGFSDRVFALDGKKLYHHE